MMPERDLPNTDLICAFSNRRLDNMSLFYGNKANSLENRRIFLEQLGLDCRHLVCAKQVHSNRVRCVGEDDRGKGSLAYDSSIDDTDGFITDRKNVPLAVFTADCLSIFLYDNKTPAVGLVHAGWRSTKGNIAAETIKLMREEFGTRAQDLYVSFGPCIRSCCYEVGPDFRNLFLQGIVQKNNRYYLDLIGINKQQLLGAGVEEENLSDSEVCTSCRNEEFFSFRKEGESCGRMMSVMMIR